MPPLQMCLRLRAISVITPPRITELVVGPPLPLESAWFDATGRGSDEAIRRLRPGDGSHRQRPLFPGAGALQNES